MCEHQFSMFQRIAKMFSFRSMPTFRKIVHRKLLNWMWKHMVELSHPCLWHFYSIHTVFLTFSSFSFIFVGLSGLYLAWFLRWNPKMTAANVTCERSHHALLQFTMLPISINMWPNSCLPKSVPVFVLPNSCGSVCAHFFAFSFVKKTDRNEWGEHFACSFLLRNFGCILYACLFVYALPALTLDWASCSCCLCQCWHFILFLGHFHGHASMWNGI